MYFYIYILLKLNLLLDINTFRYLSFTRVQIVFTFLSFMIYRLWQSRQRELRNLLHIYSAEEPIFPIFRCALPRYQSGEMKILNLSLSPSENQTYICGVDSRTLVPLLLHNLMLFQYLL